MKKTSYLEIGEQFKRKANILEGYKSGYFKEFKTLRQCFNKWSDAKENIIITTKELSDKEMTGILKQKAKQ